ncbi:hypothetical protein Fmac_029257 [Flemingia macrophylla]|uniref:Nucleotide-diphospho-sugar transferase domain-containing protein n=1 Tax=Flemingia macrophylla TaxID=520843 RepID=A0ABD1LA57_9FABA
MRAWRLSQSLYLTLLAFLIVLLCFLLYQYPRSLQTDVSKVVLFMPTQTYYSKIQELENVLRRATMPDKTVILTMVDESLASPGSVLEILLQSFKSGEGTQRLLNHLVIITMDPQAYEYCSSLHPYCIHPSTFPHHFATKGQSIVTTPLQSLFTWTKYDVLLEVDADVLWLRSPFVNFNPVDELTISCNNLSGGQRRGYLEDGGIFFLKANAISFEFFKHWKLIKVLFPNNPVQDSLCTTIEQWPEALETYGFRVQLVNTTYFGGFCKLNKDMLREAYTIQANCCDDLKSKVHDLKIVLDDWIRFRKGASGDNALDRMAPRWPLKCPRRNYTQS